ncbi:MAG: sigma-70 family RNA polymerase sigma factor [Planctomycetota bacterium]|jgi:RNA polymerase sigma-70 factor (ECF subfamily)|nr:sigma-70 family RNA polymerase sigma factor [Planctomycetota bacterium]MDP6761865.1 sigma-70 family RNA polymerase sigma factor [Planctomycetota bacterium]MDP6988800.1 sigma-70 family RNA polymerase sigma factor [Planctomycetota bacterium]
MAQTPDTGWLDVPRPARGPGFGTTSWSLVRRAGGAPSPETEGALEELCATYWYPLYVTLRRRGAGREEAEDLVQGVLARILERGDLAGLDPGRGRFRAWLAAAARHHMQNERERQRARKRGGGERVLSLDTGPAEARLASEAAEGEDPELAFERAWAQALLERALRAVGDDWYAAGKGELFDALRPVLEGGGDLPTLAALAERLGTTEGALRTASWRLRQTFGERLRAEVAETLADPGDVEDELRHLLLVLSH